MTALVIVCEVTGSQWRVWPEPESVAPGLIHETGRYLFELRGTDASAANLMIDDVPLEALRASAGATARWRWLPGYHSGSVEAELRIPGMVPRRFEITIDPDRRKLARGEFDVMLQEILSDTFALFALSSFRKGIARGHGDRPPAVARLEFLRSRIKELEAIVVAIERNPRKPRRRLKAENISVPYHRASRATGPEILRALRTGRPLSELSKQSRLPPALKGFLPQQIKVRRRLSSFDLPEHRQMLACIRYWASWLNIAADRIDRLSDGDAEVRRSSVTWGMRCRRLARRVGVLATAAPFEEVGEARAHLVLSPVFRNDPNYRRFYRLWQNMNLGIAAIFGDYLNLPLARTFELYELWCFLRLVRAAAEEFGANGIDTKDLFVSDRAGGITLSSGSVTVPIGHGLKLLFQKQYREFWVEADGRGSYSRHMVPDVVAAIDSSTADERARLIVFDAKYRIDDGLNESLNSIHTYQDALVQEAASGEIAGIVTAAYLISPSMPAVKGSSYRETAMPGRLFHPEYRTKFHFGAVTMRPGMSIPDVRSVLKTVIADSAVASK